MKTKYEQNMVKINQEQYIDDTQVVEGTQLKMHKT